MKPDLSEIPESPMRRSRVIESCHKIRSDFSRFLFAYGLRDILLIGLENVFQRPTILGRASVSKQFDGHGWNRQKEGDQDCCEKRHRAVVSPDKEASASSHKWEAYR